MLDIMPRVSILMAAYNAADFLREALDDLLSQSMRDFELVVVEDGSTDATAEILREYALRDDRMVVVHNDGNRGLPASLNRGIGLCRAPLIARADADDRYMRDRLERQLDYLDAHPEVGLLSCAVEKIDLDGRTLFVTRFPTEDGEIRMRELFVNCFSHPGSVYRRALVQEAGGYDEAFSTSQDADLWLRLRRLTKAANLDIPLVRYRKHPKQSRTGRSEKAQNQSLGVRQRALQDYLGREVPLEEARAIVDTFHIGSEHPPGRGELRIGMRGLREVLRWGRQRERPETVRYYKDLVHAALMQHARIARRDPQLRLRLIAEAALWRPSDLPKQVARKLMSKIGA